MSDKPNDAKGIAAKLDTDDTTRLLTSKTVQDKPADTEEVKDQEIKLVKPAVTSDPMTGYVTIPVSAIQHMPGYMVVITTTEGQLIVPGVGFANGQLPAEIAEDSEGSGEVVVTAAYARSQSLI